MFRYIFLAAVLAACVASAAEPVYKISKSGHYQIQAGRLVPIQIIDVDTPSPDPTPGPTPTPEPEGELAKAIVKEVGKTAASDDRHRAALKLAKVYELLSQQVIPPAKIVEVCNAFIPLALQSDATILPGVPAVVNGFLSKGTTEAACDATLLASADALCSTIPGSSPEELATDAGMKAAAERLGFDWDVFLKIILDLILKLLPYIIK